MTKKRLLIAAAGMAFLSIGSKCFGALEGREERLRAEASWMDGVGKPAEASAVLAEAASGASLAGRASHQLLKKEEAPNPKTPVPPLTVGFAVKEYFTRQGALSDFALGAVGGCLGASVGGVLMSDYFGERLENSPAAARMALAWPAGVAVLLSVLAGAIVGAVLGVGKLGQALGEVLGK